MKISIEKLVVNVKGKVKQHTDIDVNFELKNYEQEMEPQELLEMLKTYTEILKQLATQ